MKTKSPSTSFYIDANIWVYYLETSPFTPSARTFFSYISDHSDQTQLFTSALTFAEILVYPIKDKLYDFVEHIHQLFDHFENLQIVDTVKEIAIQAAYLRAEHNFRTPDAIHVATAEYMEADYLVTNDARLQEYKPGWTMPVEEVNRLIGIS